MELPASTAILFSSRDLDHWFAEEVRPHEPALRRYLARKYPSLNGAVDDVLQDTYVKILKAREKGTLVVEPRAYLYTIARHAAIDQFRRQHGGTLVSLDEPDESIVVDSSPGAPEALNHAQELALLHEAIRQLPERCRQVVTLRRLHGHTYRQIAERLGISEKTVNAHLAAGVLACRRYFRERGLLTEPTDAQLTPDA